MEGERTKRRRSYRPKVEALEALKLLDGGAAALLSPFAEHAGLPAAGPLDGQVGPLAWDSALAEADLLASSRAEADPQSVAAGLDQLDRYLGRTWARAGIGAQFQDDCSQAVYAVMLDDLGRDGFDGLVSEIGQADVATVLNRDSAYGPDFFRAVDMVKKRVLRRRNHLALEDDASLAAADEANGSGAWRGDLAEAIDRSLNPREAALIRATLDGFSPSEIASQWGLAPKTVSNEKTRVLQKLRVALEMD